MATAPRRPEAQHHRQQLEARRLRAAQLFAAGIGQSEVARQLGVTRQAANTWRGRWKQGGTQPLRSQGRPARAHGCRTKRSPRWRRPRRVESRAISTVDAPAEERRPPAVDPDQGDTR